jgi:enoyl-CoA hydratase/carnithine racemase
MSERTTGIVRLEQGPTGGVWRLLLDRPPVNALGRDMYRALIAALDRVQQDPDARCVVVGSAVDGKFCAGADIRELATLNSAPSDTSAWSEREALIQEYLGMLDSFTVPTVAAVDGYAVGAGFVLASLCDIRVATTRSWFSIPELSVRRAGGARHAMRVLPQGTARLLYLTRGHLQAERAYQLGFVDELVADGAALAAAGRIAAEIAAVPADVLREAKAALRLMEELPVTAGLQVERQCSRRMAGLEAGGGAT